MGSGIDKKSKKTSELGFVALQTVVEDSIWLWWAVSRQWNSRLRRISWDKLKNKFTSGNSVMMVIRCLKKIFWSNFSEEFLFNQKPIQQEMASTESRWNAKSCTCRAQNFPTSLCTTFLNRVIFFGELYKVERSFSAVSLSYYYSQATCVFTDSTYTWSGFFTHQLFRSLNFPSRYHKSLFKETSRLSAINKLY